jgi:hypothetical protein
MRRAALLLLTPLALAGAQLPPIGIIDLYGLRRTSERQVREALQLAEGDPLPAARDEVRKRLEALPGVAHAYVSGACCDAGKFVLFVGIQETGTPVPQFRRAPTGSVRLPDDIVRAGEALDAAVTDAVQRGVAADDGSHGHSLMQDPAARAIQERFVDFAARDLPRLRDVLQSAGDESHRALAAQVIAYAADKRLVVGDLAGAMRDPSPDVRNNAMRALALIAALAQRRPELRLVVPATPLVDMLTSPVWSDRNKAAAVLLQLTERRNPTLLRDLRERALPSLVEMANWRSRAHAADAFVVLGRVAGLPDDAIFGAWSRRDGPSTSDPPAKPER